MWSFPDAQIKSKFHCIGMYTFVFPFPSSWRWYLGGSGRRRCELRQDLMPQIKGPPGQGWAEWWGAPTLSQEKILLHSPGSG